MPRRKSGDKSPMMSSWEERKRFIKTVAIPRDLADMAAIVAKHEGISVAELIDPLIREPIRFKYVEAVRAMQAEIDTTPTPQLPGPLPTPPPTQGTTDAGPAANPAAPAGGSAAPPTHTQGTTGASDLGATGDSDQGNGGKSAKKKPKKK